MRFNPINLFARKPVAQAAKEAADATSGLYNEEAVDLLVRMLTRLPDLDVTLRQAGIKREKLSVLLSDDEISQACETRLDALLATPFRLEPSEGEPATKLMEILKPVLQDAVSSTFKARLFGYSVMEAVYEQREDGLIGLKFLGEKPLEWFEPKSDGRLIYYPNNGMAAPTGIEVDQKYKFHLTRSRPTYANPYGEALLSRLYWPWFFRNNGWKFWGKFLERFGSPLLVGSSADPKKMVAALLAAHSNAVLGVGPNDEVTAVGVPAGNSGQAFDTFEVAVVRRIQKVVLGQTLTSGTDGGSGNRALGQVHDTVRKDKRNSDVAMITSTMQRVVDALCALNGWPKHEAVFADDVGLETDRADRDTKLYQQGVRFTAEYYTDNYDLREVDFTLSSEAPGPGDTPPEPGSGASPKEPGKPGQKAPATGGAKGGPGAKAALDHIAFSKGKFTANQQELEDQADVLLDSAGTPLNPDAVRKAIFAASSPEDLADRLFALVGDAVAQDDFVKLLERALFAGDVLGYVHSEKG
jgi:Mu-like prophage protein gp29